MQELNNPGPSGRVFLSAQWLDLLMLNYAVDPSLLQPYVPAGTELNFFAGKAYVSLVGFRFQRTKLWGRIPIPFHTNFDEINLRLYVRRHRADGDRRGVVFISEIVPRRSVAMLARIAYGENYTRHPMRHKIVTEKRFAQTSLSGAILSEAQGLGSADEGTLARTDYQCQYEFRLARNWCKLHAKAPGPGVQPDQTSLEQFITEHYWGYARRRNGSAVEYHVSHVPWRVWKTAAAGFEGDAASLYGPALAALIRRPPDSAFIANGSPVLVFTGRPIT